MVSSWMVGLWILISNPSPSRMAFWTRKLFGHLNTGPAGSGLSAECPGSHNPAFLWIRPTPLLNILSSRKNNPFPPLLWLAQTVETTLNSVVANNSNWPMDFSYIAIPYSRKHLREKTFANWWKTDFCGENVPRLLTFAAPKDAMPQISRRNFS